MKSRSNIAKLKMVYKMNIDSFIKKHGIAYPDARCHKINKKRIWDIPKQGKRQGNCIFGTMTFENPIFSKKKAEKIKSDYLKKLKVNTPFDYCCVPEHHESGAYHFHFLIALHDKNISINQLIARGKKMKFIGYVAYEWTFGPIENVAKYLTDYLTAENLNSIGGRAISYSKGVLRVANMRCTSKDSQWISDWRVMSLSISEDLNCSIDFVRRWYDEKFSGVGRSTRLRILDMYKLKEYDEIKQIIKYEITRFMMQPLPRHPSDIRHSLFIANMICLNSQNFENEWNKSLSIFLAVERESNDDSKGIHFSESLRL